MCTAIHQTCCAGHVFQVEWRHSSTPSFRLSLVSFLVTFCSADPSCVLLTRPRTFPVVVLCAGEEALVLDITQILPNIGAPVTSAAFDEAAAADMSLGQAAYAATFFTKLFAKKLADPAAAHEIAQFTHSAGADWSGFHSTPHDHNASTTQDASTQERSADNTEAQTAGATENSGITEDSRATEDAAGTEEGSGDASMVAVVDIDGHTRHGRVPVAPENYYDTLPAMAHMLRQHQAAMDAALTHFAAHVQPAIQAQQVMFGVPEGVKAYRDEITYFRDVLKISAAQTKKIMARIPYVTWTPGKNPGWLAYQPSMPAVAASFAQSNISGENLDRIVGLDQDLTKCVHKTNALPEAKSDALAVLEPALVDAAETATPDELSKEKSRWANAIAHALDPDGPPVADALRKPADNAIRTRSYTDGSGLISIHATGPIFAQFKNWALHQVNGNGTQVKLDPDLINLLKTDGDEDDQAPTAAETVTDLNDLKTKPHSDATAEDDAGNTIPADQAAAIDRLSSGQRLAAIVIGMFQTILTMDPTELGAKSAHGTSAQLMIVQDIQTAYETLGVGALPEAVRRPPGPAGVLPPITSQPNPDDPTTPVCEDPRHTRGHSPPSWTQFISEAINIGAFHPQHAKQLACDSKLVGQIWNGHHDVLVQHRAKRLFTPAQRRAILARDRGCQAPGCTVPAVYCQIHHIVEWLNGGSTDVDNAITVCALHHGAIHDEKWRIRKRHGITFFQPAPWLDPTQPLLRNLYWNI